MKATLYINERDEFSFFKDFLHEELALGWLLDIQHFHYFSEKMHIFILLLSRLRMSLH